MASESMSLNNSRQAASCDGAVPFCDSGTVRRGATFDGRRGFQPIRRGGAMTQE